jgi:DNA-binding PadR family transcriptional regulator
MAVLTVLLDQPGHGYDVGLRAVSRFSPPYRLTVQHVYGNLRRLRRMGFIEPIDLDEVPDLKHPERGATFKATADGARGFRGWLGSSFRDWFGGPVRPEIVRRELFTRLRALRVDDYGAMLRLFDLFEDAMLRSIGYVARGEPLTIVDDLAREDHEAEIGGALVWVAGAREKVLDRIAAEMRR